MVVRSRYTGRTHARPAESHRRERPPEPAREGLTAKAKKAVKAVSDYMERNKRDYQRKTGDYNDPWDDLIEYPKRVIRETAKFGEEERRRIAPRPDSDEEIVRFMSGKKSQKRCQPCHQQQYKSEPRHEPRREQSSKHYVEIVIKQNSTPRRPRQKTVKLPYDPDAEVE